MHDRTLVTRICIVIQRLALMSLVCLVVASCSFGGKQSAPNASHALPVVTPSVQPQRTPGPSAVVVLPGHAILAGTIRDAATMHAIAGATIRVDPSGAVTYADALGHFTMDVALASSCQFVDVSVEKPGFGTFRRLADYLVARHTYDAYWELTTASRDSVAFAPPPNLHCTH